MARVDYYGLLGVPPRASQAEIRTAYRRLARRLHPDANPPAGDDAAANRRMATLNEAYGVLSDPTRRAQYDLQRQRWADLQRRRARAPAVRDPVSQPARDAAPRAPARLVFCPSADLQVGRAFASMAMLGLGVFGAYVVLTRGALIGAALTGAGLIGAALTGLAALPYFAGYLELTGEALLAHATFGLLAARVYRLDEICEVHWRPRWGRRRAGVRILIDYYRRDKAGRLDVDRYDSAWLMAVDDPSALYRALHGRATGRKHAHTRPTWAAVVVGGRDAIAIVVALICVTVVAILWAGTWT
ncbi:MAG: DnaJ domain-containing protein [Anaerolineae bacterium]|nr:DnaJ domain-containing protein [Anaerolineae bacterium]